MKLSSRDILRILRYYELASDDDTPRQVKYLKITHPTPKSTLGGFQFKRHQFYVLFDEEVADCQDDIVSQIKLIYPNINGELWQNPYDQQKMFATPFQGKTCFLFQVISPTKRLDSALAEKFPDHSRSFWQSSIKKGYVDVNGQVVNLPKTIVKDDDKITVNLPTPTDFSKKELPIIYLDDNVIVVDKPAGVLTHSKGALNDEFTVADFFRRYTTYNLDTNRPGIIHRLDRGTSGVIIGARNERTAKMLQKQFSERKTKKTYFAILEKMPKEPKAEIDLPIGRNPAQPSTFRVDANGKNALTRYEVIASNQPKTLVKLQPATGRTHQLRVHLRYLNTPILGDTIYGGKPADRMYLHAKSLEITIPHGNRQIFIADLPKEFIDYFPEAK